MDNKEIIRKLRSVELCMTAHPDCEKGSEFEDRIIDLQEIQQALKLADVSKFDTADVIERAFYAGREMTTTNEKGMLFKHVYKEFTDYKKSLEESDVRNYLLT